MDDEHSCLSSVGNFLRRMGVRTRHYIGRVFRNDRSASFEVPVVVLEPRVFGPALAPGAPYPHASQPLTDGDDAERQLIDWRPPTPPPMPTPPFTHYGARKRLRMTPMPTCDLDTLSELRHALNDLQQKVQIDGTDDTEKDISNPTGITFDDENEQPINDTDIVHQKET
ncbi:hypothetical protein LSTR_LSTR007859 [Laodelphax striatellus]|uniref:Uncharacterized protein n=1 Tax=Laodelphax striatellus TaxID=195883 RepID=A0A482WNM0_LAOST|nr:hypothetical protein LSTR_LSTR007859 [Laodelphax striatellus]